MATSMATAAVGSVAPPSGKLKASALINSCEKGGKCSFQDLKA